MPRKSKSVSIEDTNKSQDMKKINEIEISNTLNKILEEIKNLGKKQDVLKEQVELYGSTIFELERKIKNFETKIEQLDTLIMEKNNLHIDVNNLKKKMMSIEDTIVNHNTKEHKDHLYEENLKMNNKIISLQNQINHIVHDDKKNNIIIAGISTQPNEDNQNIIQKIFQHLNVEVKKEDILNTTRINLKKENSPIILKLKNNDIKEKLMKRRKEIKVMYVNELQLKGPNNIIYFNEHLTLEKQQLFKECRKVKREKNFKFVWCKNNNIFLRKDNNSKIYNINNLNDLENVF